MQQKVRRRENALSSPQNVQSSPRGPPRPVRRGRGRPSVRPRRAGRGGGGLRGGARGSGDPSPSGASCPRSSSSLLLFLPPSPSPLRNSPTQAHPPLLSAPLAPSRFLYSILASLSDRVSPRAALVRSQPASQPANTQSVSLASSPSIPHGHSRSNQRRQDLSYVLPPPSLPRLPPFFYADAYPPLARPQKPESRPSRTSPFLSIPWIDHPRSSCPLASLSQRVAVDDPRKIVKVVASDGKSGDTRDLIYTNCKVVGNGSFGIVFQAKLLEDSNPVCDIAIKKVLQDKRFKVLFALFIAFLVALSV